MSSIIWKTVSLLISAIIVSCSENQTEIQLCGKCTCQTENNAFITNCQEKQITWSPQEWSNTIITNKIASDSHIVLILNGNKITKLKELPSMNASMIDMYLSGCDLEKITHGAFSNMKEIHHLDLGFNQLKGEAVRGDVFKGPFNSEEFEPIDLETLNLEHNLIHSLDRRTFQHTPKLQNLYLNDNPMNLIDATTSLALSSVKNLRLLDISRIGLKTIPDDLFNNMRRLEQLYISGNKLMTVPESIGSLGYSLEILNIDSNQIEELNDNSFLGLWRLESLEVSNMSTLTQIKPEAFLQLKSLKVLRVTNNTNLGYISEHAFLNSSIDRWSLKELYLQNNSLTEIPSNLVPWNLIYSVNLEDNPWNCDCISVMNMRTKELNYKLSKSSSTEAKCITPIEASGINLYNIVLEDVCPIDIEEIKIQNKVNTAPKLNYIIIGFSVVVIVVFLGVLVGVRVTYWKRKVGEMRSVPIRYTNMNNEYSG